VTFTWTEKDFRRQQDAAFSIITNILQVMTVLMAAVGSLGLSGTLSINVYERRREIGVMRAVGASSLDVALIFIGEGLLLGIASWVVAVPLSYVGGKLFVDALGAVFGLPFLYRYPMDGAMIWMGVIIVLSVVASWLPARRATQISVRESLAYE
jgi:putative ABC transport system permease protein